MPIECAKSTSGGKGNVGMFIEREPKICAAGIPSAQADDRVGDSLQHYLLKDEVDALLSDAIHPLPKPLPRPPLRRPIPRDMRNSGPTGQMSQLINPPLKTKFQTLVDDVKETTYTSYWKNILGKVPDPVPMLPEKLVPLETTFGKKTPFHGRLYDIVMPKDPLPDKTPESKKPSYQIDRNYCKPSYDPNLVYGYRSNVDKRGTYARCCLTDDRKVLGTSNFTKINAIQSNLQDANQPRIGEVLAPNNNLKEVPEGYTFGKLKPPDNLPECLTFCEINPDRAFLKKCLAHLNSLRKCLSKKFLPTFYRGFYLNLKYFDKEKSGWLPKDIVYNFCATKLIRFDPTLIEPLLTMWNAFDGAKIEYKIFVRVINYREPSPDIPKVEDIPEKCLDFRTTYTEMVKPNQVIDNRLLAGLPSGRYFDMDYPIVPENCCRAFNAYLPHESDMKACLAPSILTLMGVSHRDMYAKRDEATVKQVFEAAGEKFSDGRFEAMWEEAKKHHPQGWVCFETFRRALTVNSN